MKHLAELLYRNARTKATITARRQLRQFMRGEIDVLPCSYDTEQDFIKKAIERALTKGEPHAS